MAKKFYPNALLPQHGRGYFGIGIYASKVSANIGTLWRSADLMGADFMFIICRRYQTMRTDKLKSWKHIPLFEYENFEQFRASLPKDSRLVGIELDERSTPITSYCHPERAVYLLGAEDIGLPPEVLVQLPGRFSLNVSVAGSIVLYDRVLKLAQRHLAATSPSGR